MNKYIKSIFKSVLIFGFIVITLNQFTPSIAYASVVWKSGEENPGQQFLTMAIAIACICFFIVVVCCIAFPKKVNSIITKIQRKLGLKPDWDKLLKEEAEENNNDKEENIDIVFCKKCGNKIEDDSLFCKKCGSKIER